MPRSAPHELRAELQREIRRARTPRAQAQRVVEYISDIARLSPSASLAPLIEMALAWEGGAAKRLAAIAGEPRMTTLEGVFAQHVRAHGEARAAIYREPMFDTAEVARALGLRTKNPREHLMRLRRSNGILAVPKGRHHVYPAFQFDLDRRRVHPVVPRVAKLLDALHDRWGVVSWWLTPNTRLPDAPSPKSLLGVPGGYGVIERLAQAVVEEPG